jgi:hypothetical protein
MCPYNKIQKRTSHELVPTILDLLDCHAPLHYGRNDEDLRQNACPIMNRQKIFLTGESESQTLNPKVLVSKGSVVNSIVATLFVEEIPRTTSSFDHFISTVSFTTRPCPSSDRLTERGTTYIGKYNRRSSQLFTLILKPLYESVVIIITI